jgi:hypothetical protein
MRVRRFLGAGSEALSLALTPAVRREIATDAPRARLGAELNQDVRREGP